MSSQGELEYFSGEPTQTLPNGSESMINVIGYQSQTLVPELFITVYTTVNYIVDP